MIATTFTFETTLWSPVNNIWLKFWVVQFIAIALAFQTVWPDGWSIAHYLVIYNYQNLQK